MNTILIPVDFSPGSRSALLYGLSLATKANLRVVVFHAFQASGAGASGFSRPSTIQELEREKSAELDKYVTTCKFAGPEDLVLDFTSFNAGEKPEQQAPVQSVKAYHTGVLVDEAERRYAAPVTCVAKLGTVYEQTETVAVAYEADLIVMGMQGRNALSHALVGSTTLSVMRNSRLPVIGVPLHAKAFDLESVVFATDLRQQPDVLLLDKLRDLVKTFGLQLQVLHLYRQKDRQAELTRVQGALDVLDKLLPDINYRVTLQRRENLAGGIQEYLQTHRADLLILSPQRHSALQLLLNKSVTARMAAYNFLPLLSLPASQSGLADDAEEEQQLASRQEV